PSPVKVKAEKLSLKVRQPENLNEESFLYFLRDAGTDLFVVVAYGNILPREILNLPRIFSINLHASLLPKYRGAAPISWAIWNGEEETGVTVIKMNEQMDAGEIILQKRIPILEEDDALTLGERLSIEGADLLLEAIELIEKGKVIFLPQDEREVSFAPLLKKGDGRIDWKTPAKKINAQIRALVPWPGSYCFWKNKLLKLWRAQVVEEDFRKSLPGEIVEIREEGFVVATGEGGLLIKELQLAGGKRMPVEKFIPGHHLEKGEFLA
ncbi:MAG: methionyl-tRNA formyltransferase, partial [Candidatus Omnitrophota bacterium]